MSALVPTLPAARGASPFITIGGTMLALPISARVDLAYQWTYRPVDVNTTANVLAQSVTVTGDVIEIPLSYNVTLETSATVAARLLAFQIITGGVSYVTIPAPATQAASLTGQYDFNVDTNVAYSVGATNIFQVAGIPSTTVFPGSSYGVQVLQGAKTGDGLSPAAVKVIRVPTGPTAARPETVETPVLT